MFVEPQAWISHRLMQLDAHNAVATKESPHSTHFVPTLLTILPHTCAGAMATDFLSLGLPIPEQALKDLSKGILGIIPKFAELESDSGVK
jgi:hypothetical protein